MRYEKNYKAKKKCKSQNSVAIPSLPTQRMSWKVNAAGEYLRFQGITVVASAINDVLTEFWENIYSELKSCRVVTDQYALLPYESYHMTTLNVQDQGQRSDKEWYQFVHNSLPWMHSLHQRLERDAMRPKVVLDRIVAGGTIMIFLRLDPEQDARIRTTAKDFDIMHATQPVYHITLAYRYTDVTAPTQAEVLIVLDKIFQRIANQGMELEPPKLCYFSDMTAFIPWEAQHNPFPV
jgi:hypothetical protein